MLLFAHMGYQKSLQYRVILDHVEIIEREGGVVHFVLIDRIVDEPKQTIYPDSAHLQELHHHDLPTMWGRNVSSIDDRRVGR